MLVRTKSVIRDRVRLLLATAQIFVSCSMATQGIHATDELQLSVKRNDLTIRVVVVAKHETLQDHGKNLEVRKGEAVVLQARLYDDPGAGSKAYLFSSDTGDSTTLIDANGDWWIITAEGALAEKRWRWMEKPPAALLGSFRFLPGSSSYLWSPGSSEVDLSNIYRYKDPRE